MSKARVSVWLGVVLGGCLGEASRLAERTEGRLELTAEVPVLGPVEVQFIPEEDLKSFLEVRLSQSRAEVEKLAAERQALKTRAEQCRAEEAVAAEQLRKNNGEIFHRRLEVVRRAKTVGEMAAQRRFLTGQSMLAKRTALEVRERAAAAQRDFEAAEEAAQQLRDGSFIFRELPAGTASVSLETGTRSHTTLATGRYALAARALGTDGVMRVWLLWTRVEAGGVRSLVLHEKNLALTECVDCVLSPKSPVVNRD